MNITASYNGWSGKVRTVRGNLFYAALKKKEIPAAVTCYMCGRAQPGGMTYHAEEYGPTWEEYLQACKPLCPTCHGMLHLRFKFVNRFKRYKQRIVEGADIKFFPHIGAFFAYAKNLPDIPEYTPNPVTGKPWLDAIPLTPYHGIVKIATIVNPDKDDPLPQIPDPAVYSDLGVTGMEGLFRRLAIIHNI